MPVAARLSLPDAELRRLAPADARRLCPAVLAASVPSLRMPGGNWPSPSSQDSRCGPARVGDFPTGYAGTLPLLGTADDPGLLPSSAPNAATGDIAPASSLLSKTAVTRGLLDNRLPRNAFLACVTLAAVPSDLLVLSEF